MFNLDYKKVKVIVDIPKQETHEFYKINPKGITLNDKDKLQVDFNLGFKNIAEYFSYMVLPYDKTGIDSICLYNNTLVGNTRALIDLQGCYKNFINKEEINLNKIIDLLINNNFLLSGISPDVANYVLFDDKKLPIMHLQLSLRLTVNTSLITGLITKDFFDKLNPLVLENIEPKAKNISLTQLTHIQNVKKGSSVDYSVKSIQLKLDMDYCLQEFYPWIKIDLVQYFTEFINSKSNVLVLIGPPGTGKSTLIRTMIKELEMNCLLAYKPEVIVSPFFVEVCQQFLENHTQNKFGNYAVQYPIMLQPRPSDPFTANIKTNISNPNVIVVEDADIIMSKRSDGNHRMSEILNATSGIATDSNSKFILSTNLKDIDDIDPALLRPGRCFDILCFRDLTADEANTVRKVKNLSERQFNPTRKYKLAEVLNDCVTQQQVEPVVKPRFGF